MGRFVKNNFYKTEKSPVMEFWILDNGIVHVHVPSWVFWKKCLYTTNVLAEVHAAIKCHNHNSLMIWRDVDTSKGVFWEQARKTSGLRLALFSNVTDGVKNPGRLQPQAAINKGNAWFLANSVSGVLSLFSDKRNLAAAAQSTVIISTSPTIRLSGQIS